MKRRGILGWMAAIVGSWTVEQIPGGTAMAHGLRKTAFDQSSYDYWTGQYGLVNVRDFGAVGDGVHDDTAAIQRAIDSIATTGGTILFPDGVYLINDGVRNPITTNGYNTALALPYNSYVSSSEGPNPIPITLQGITFPAMQPSELSPESPLPVGAVILTTETIAATPNQSLLGGPTQPSYKGTVLTVRIRNLTFRQPYPALYIGIDLAQVFNMDLDGVQVDVNNPPSLSPAPANGDLTGIAFPQSYDFSDYGHVSCTRFYVQSYGTGINPASHAHIDDGVIQNCYNSVGISTGNHPIYIGHINSEQAVHDINAQAKIGQTPRIYVAVLDIETTASNNVNRINDPNNQLQGEVNFITVIDNPGTSGFLPMNGGANLIVRNLNDVGPKAVTPPASPLASGTVYQNTLGTAITIYQPAYATTAGTAGSIAVALGSSDTPSTLYTQWVNGSTTSSLPETLPPLRVPPGWWYSFTTTGATLADAQIQGE